MNKSAIKNFAIKARKNLMTAVEQKAYEIGITQNGIKDIETFQGGFRINNRIFKAVEVEQRKKLIQKIREKGFEQIIEEVAYTWFIRFIALRYMEVNEYLPTGVRVLSSTEANKTEPDIIREALNIELDVDKDLVYQYQDKNDMEGLFKYLLIKQCNELAKIMPVMFEEIEDDRELLLPDHLLSEGSIVRDLVENIDEEDFKEQVEIIGWLYQYYISEKKDQVFEGLKKNVKITKENIPPATQLFTPDWIVKYMVENSLGRLWLESHPNEALKQGWKYYLEEVEQEPDVKKQLEEIRNKDINPEEIKVLDPAMGSGHILVYAFDVLYEIYKSAGYSERDIPKLILKKNLYGLDIDDRAGQLAYFALIMKARSKNRRIFRENIELNLCSIQESNGFPKEAIDLLVSRIDTESEKVVHRQDVEYLIEIFRDAKDYGSILDVKKIDFEAIEKKIEEVRRGQLGNLLDYQYRNDLVDKVTILIKQAKIMSSKYNVVCTNPPYMGIRNMNPKLSDFVYNRYPMSKYDLFAVFIERCSTYSLEHGFTSMITQHAWMFLSSFDNLRNKIINNLTINSMLHLGPRAFEEISGEVVQCTSFVLRSMCLRSYEGKYIRLIGYNSPHEKEVEFFNYKNQFFSRATYFNDITGIPIAYWVSEKVRRVYTDGIMLETIAKPKQGLATCNNDKFLRLWYEVNISRIGFNITNRENAKTSNYRWFPYNKGGSFRKWYGNNEYVINWENDGLDIHKYNNIPLTYNGAPVRNKEYYFRESITWSFISSTKFAVRYCPNGFAFDVGGSSVFPNHENIYFLTAFLCSKLTLEFLKIQNPTLNFQVGNIATLPVIKIKDKHTRTKIDIMANENIQISKADWDSFETSWDFLKHPLLSHKNKKRTIKETFNQWEDYASIQFSQLKRNEEEINRIFIDIYNLKDEFTDEVDDKDITVSMANNERDTKSYISYAVGCIFGRYSLDEKGLIYAGGDLNIDRYKIFKPTDDNIVPIADEVYFEEDIVNRFIGFVRITFGAETLEENLDYIAETLNKKPSETSRQTIRRYFISDFYKDHVQVYKKRPIYWLFDSGKQNGFKALIYMHRYDPYTVARVRTDYLHKLQKKYDAEISRLDILLESDVSQAEKVKTRKKKEDLRKKMQECVVYDQAIAHVANQKIEIDLDDGVVVNYAKFQGIEIPQGEGKKPLKADLLAKV